MSALLELAARVESASGPDRALDVLIGCAVAYVPHKPGCEWAAPERGWQYIPAPFSGRMGCADSSGNVAAHWEPPAYTASLDASTGLFPSEPEWPAVFWRSGHDGEGPDPARFFAELLLCENDRPRRIRAVADTEELARTAAALRALSSSSELVKREDQAIRALTDKGERG